jgi:hypothetical protein
LRCIGVLLKLEALNPNSAHDSMSPYIEESRYLESEEHQVSLSYIG